MIILTVVESYWHVYGKCWITVTVNVSCITQKGHRVGPSIRQRRFRLSSFKDQKTLRCLSFLRCAMLETGADWILLFREEYMIANRSHEQASLFSWICRLVGSSSATGHLFPGARTQRLTRGFSLFIKSRLTWECFLFITYTYYLVLFHASVSLKQSFPWCQNLWSCRIRCLDREETVLHAV